MLCGINEYMQATKFMNLQELSKIQAFMKMCRVLSLPTVVLKFSPCVTNLCSIKLHLNCNTVPGHHKQIFSHMILHGCIIVVIIIKCWKVEESKVMLAVLIKWFCKKDWISIAFFFVCSPSTLLFYILYTQLLFLCKVCQCKARKKKLKKFQVTSAFLSAFAKL